MQFGPSNHEKPDTEYENILIRIPPPPPLVTYKITIYDVFLECTYSLKWPPLSYISLNLSICLLLIYLTHDSQTYRHNEVLFQPRWRLVDNFYYWNHLLTGSRHDRYKIQLLHRYMLYLECLRC